MNNDKGKIALDFNDKKQEIIELLKSNNDGVMVLATSYNNRVMARNVLIVNNGLEFYFFTWNHSRKCEQIKGNSRVALCKDRLQIEGKAEILGGLLAKTNEDFLAITKEKFPDAIEFWSKYPGMVIVRIKPTFIVIAGSGDDTSLDFVDLENQKAYREKWAHYE